jgi:hypothetical protein
MSVVKQRNFKRAGLFAALLAAGLLLIGVAQASAEVKWQLVSTANSTVAPGDGDTGTAELTYLLRLGNGGDSSAEGSAEPIVFNASLPPGFTVQEMQPEYGFSCPGVSVGDSAFSCEKSDSFEAFVATSFTLKVSVASTASGIGTALFELSGGTAPAPASTADPTRVTSTPAQFGIDAFDVGLGASPAGDAFTQAAGHPYAFRTAVDFNTHADPDPYYGEATPVEPIRDAYAALPPGLVGNPTAAGKCTLLQLSAGTGATNPTPLCPTDSQVGKVTVRFLGGLGSGAGFQSIPLFNMEPPPGAPARFGFNVLGVPVIFDAKLRSDGDYGLTAAFENISEGLTIISSDVELWGVPGDPSHDSERACSGQSSPFEGGPTCTASSAPQAFLRMPTSCTAAGQGLPFGLEVDSWSNPGALGANGRPASGDPRWKSDSLVSHEAPGYPFSPEDPSTPWGAPIGTTGCADVPVQGSLSATPTALDTETSSGLGVHVEIPNPGLENPKGIASSDIKDVKLTLPQGLTINPSQAEGLGVCSPAQYESTRLEFHPDGAHGCPSDSKVGTVSVNTPLLDDPLPGEVYVAKPYENPFNSLLAIYIVVAEPQTGILVKLPGEIRLNEETGRIEAEFDDLPQTPFETFDFHFREGARAPLVTPPACGTYESEAVFTPWSDPSHKITSISSFQVIHGIGGGPCPPNGTPGFKPLFSAGSINNNAASFSPFNMRIQRNDGEQDMTRFSAVLPPGVLGKLAGVSKCPQAAIAIAKSKSGNQEIASPSCPANSEIGHSLVGAGVGSVLAHVPGKVYLGGPFHGDPLSVIAITPAVAGPFDVGTVVVHEALTLNPKTAEVEVDGSASDPIPHILKGIPAKLRDLRVYVDRPEFTLNPTSCDPSATDATLFGGGGNAFSSLDDMPVFLSDRFQAANCSSLGFKPRLGLRLKGSTKRGGHPGLTATYRPRPGDANAAGLVVRLPRSAFLDQAHIRTICTRVQFAADSCPKGARYGYIKAWTPLLETPLEGPVWLRSSNHKLPDLVFDLHGLVDVEVATRIDSIRGGIRATVAQIPDAPISKVVLKMQGGKKGLIVNSRNLCGSTNRANASFEGQNRKASSLDPVMRADCGGGGKHKRGGGGSRDREDYQ